MSRRPFIGLTALFLAPLLSGCLGLSWSTPFSSGSVAAGPGGADVNVGFPGGGVNVGAGPGGASVNVGFPGGGVNVNAGVLGGGVNVSAPGFGLNVPIPPAGPRYFETAYPRSQAALFQRPLAPQSTAQGAPAPVTTVAATTPVVAGPPPGMTSQGAPTPQPATRALLISKGPGDAPTRGDDLFDDLRKR